MRKIYILLLLVFAANVIFAQCPPPGFPNSGNTCQQAPILCDNLDGYCNTINNNNVQQNFPGCGGGWVLNNDEWFAFFAGTTTITIQITPTNCTSTGSNQGLQAGIYHGCGGSVMDVQCACEEDPFILTSTNYVVGDIYWFVIDGCAGDVCDYSIDVLAGSTVPFPPVINDPVTGPNPICAGTSGTYSIPDINGASTYTWTLNPPSMGTMTGGNDQDVNVAWAANASGTAQLCVSVGNYCYPNADSACITVNVTPRPTAAISGSGIICAGSNSTVNLTVTFTGIGPWTFTPSLNGVPQTPITTTDNPYTFPVTQAGTWTLQSVRTEAGAQCPGTVSGTAVVTEITLNPSSTTVAATCGQSNGSVNLSVSGGNAPYTYIWSNGITTQDLSSTPPGTYTVTITDNNGCTVTHTATIADNMVNLNLSAVTTNNTNCATPFNGSINLSVSPSGSYTYNWSNGATTEDINNLEPGTYLVTVTQGVTCTATGSYTVTDQPNNPNITFSVVNTTCDLPNGSINVSVSGGTTPYTFIWSNGATTEDLSNLLAGSYQVTVTSPNGCTDTETITITNNNPPITITPTVVANTNCNGTGNGSITISVSPSGTYTYNWSNGSTTQNQSNLLPGTYSLTVTGQGSCSQTMDITVPDQPLNPTVTYTTVQSTCDLANGSINVSVSGGVTPYTYLWSNGATTQDLNNILAGSYSLTVTGANGCTASADITVTNNNPPINISGTTMPNTTCNGSFNGSISVTVTPPAAYTYLWSTGASTLNLSNLAAGTYTITVTGQGSCSQTAEFTVAENANVPNVVPSVIPSSCDLPNGSVNLSVSGSVPPYTFSWSNGATTQNQSNVLAGNYVVTVTGSNGCSTVASIDIPNVNPPININATVVHNTTCTGANGSIDLTVTPPNPNYTYTWSNGPTTQDQNNLPPGDYTVTVSAGGTCVEVQTFTIDNNPNEPNLSYTQVDASCGLSNGSINLSVTGGVLPYTYLWSNGATTQDLNNIPAEIYTVTVTGGNGCTSVEGVVINNNMIPISIDAFVNPKTSCVTNNGSINLVVTPANVTVTWDNGSHSLIRNNLAPGLYSVTVSAGGTCTETATYEIYEETEYPALSTDVTAAYCSISNGAIDLEVSGGATPYTYKWSNNAMTQDLANLAANTYTVTVTSALGCSAVISADIPNNDISIGINGVIYDNLSCVPPLNGAIDLEISPDGYNYQFSWASGHTGQNLSNLAPGIYTVIVRLGTTCSATETFEVLNAAVAPNVSAVGIPATCGLNNGATNLTATGASYPYTFLWSNGGTTEDLNNVLPGTYTVVVTDFFGCKATTTATVTNNNIPLNITATTTDNTSCAAVNGGVNITVNPAGGYTYLWSNSSVSEDLTNIPSGTYTVTVSAGTSCSGVASFTVANNTSDPVIAPVITPAICTNPNGGIDLTISGAPGPYGYNWSNSATSQDLTGILPGTYAVTVTGSNGCTTDTILVVPNNSSTFSLSGTAQPLTNCAANNGSIDLVVTPSGPYTYLWSTGIATEDISNLPDGIYTVSVTETGTCTASISFVISDNRTYPNSNQNINVELCNLQNGAIDLSVTGGVTPYSFIWSNGETTEDLSNITDGAYSVTISGANNCTATATVNVPDNDVSFSINGTPVNNTSCVAVNGAVDLDILPGDPGNGLTYSYQWSNNVFTQDQANLDAGIYAVTVSAGGTCTATASYNLVNDAQAPNVAVAVLPAFCGQNSGLVDLTVTGGQTPYTFNWSTASASEDLAAVPPGTYSVTVTGSNGCTTVDSYDVTENVTIPSITGVPTSNTSCISNNGAIALSVSPTTLTYTYVWSSGQNTPNLQAIPGGSYSVTVSAGGSCIGVASFNVPNDITTVSLGGSTVDVLCFGNSTGAVNLSVNSGTPPYQYNWSPAAGNVEDLSNLSSGNYLVTVTDANGCSAATAFNVQQPGSSVQVNCQLLNDVTSPTSTDGAGAVNISGGTPPYDVAWNPGGTQNNVIPGVFTIDNLPQGAYLVNITDNNGCPATCNFNIGLVPCQTAVGTLSNSLISLCGSGCISANYNAANQFLDPNDALQFVLHEGTSNQIVNEITRSNQPTFCFDPSTMQYGVTYYISAVAGNADPSGNVILNAYCTVISFPTPIVFFEKPVASIVQPFDLNCEVREVNLIGSSNLPGSTYLWTTLDGTLIGSVNQANAKAGKAGTYEFFVTVNGCKDTSAVQVKDISNSPEAIIAATPDDLLDCVIDEITLLGTAEGTFNANLIWISNGNQYTPGTTLQIDNPGTYQFVILDTLTRCADTAQIVINENLQYPPLFLNPPTVLTCNNPTTTLVGGSPFPGIQFQWAVVSGSDTTIVGTGGNLQVNTPGVYWIFGIDPANQCKNSLSTTVNANQILPNAEAGPGFSIKCFGETANLSGSATSGSGQINYQWSTANGFIVNGATSASPLINKPGTYVLLVTDPSNGCTDSDNVIINPIDPTAMATVTQPPCFGDKGSIVVDEVIGGKPPVMFSLNDGPLTIQNTFYNLAPGPYTVVVQDAEGCSTTLSALLIEPEEFQIFVVPEVTIDLGENYQIITQISPPLTPIESVRWTPSTGLSCDTCLILTANPFISTQYKVEVKTEAGCRDNATLRLLVDRRVDVYIPNVFSPDGDGENDYFTVFADTKGVLKINSLQVYSRWGELLWENYDFQPNNPSIGWDGTYRGQDMNPAVFVYQAEVEFIDGRKELFKGDVTIKR